MRKYHLIIALILFVFARSANGQTSESDKAKEEIHNLLRNKFAFYEKDENGINHHFKPSDILIMDDRIEIKAGKSNKTIYFTDELVFPPGSNYITLGNIEFIEFKAGDAQKLGQNIILIQNLANDKYYKSQLVLFEPVAAKYRELEVKPSITEEQRKFVVQANSNFQEKNYEKAIAAYLHAIETDPVAYPSAYSNLALLSAQLKRYPSSIYYMKKYLMLVPDASDARSAQDKIYEWEDKITNN